MGFRLAHISDTHIRNLKYHDDYRAIFEQMYSILRKEKPDYIVHCGDVAHTKTNLSPEFFEMAADFFDSLSDIAPLVLIAGNHDGNLKNSNRQDALTPVIKALDKGTIHYLKNSGEFSPERGITFNVLSVFDRDNWVEPSDDDSINIALYHGAISGVETDIGWVMDHGEDDVGIFEGHDFALLGDIHKTNQVLDTEGRVRYSGSTVQQNFGETNDKGFLIWDIEDKDTFDVRHFILENPRPFITIELTRTGRLPRNTKPPKGSRLRIVTNHSIPIEKVRKAIDVAKTKFAPESVTFLNRTSGSRSKVNLDDNFEKYNLRDVAVQEKLIKEYLSDYLSNTEEDNLILQEVYQINRRINSEAQHTEDIQRNINWSIKTLEWNNLFNYGEGNKIDFDSLGGLVGVFGKNFSGKSSIVDSLLWVMFNTTSKRNRKTYDIINQNKSKAWGKAVIEVGDKEFTIERTSEKYIKKLKGEETEEAKTDLNFSVYDQATQEVSSLNGTTRSKTDDNVKKFFGSLDDFLVTSLSSQLESLKFISEGSTKRKEILAKFLDLEIFDTKDKIAKEESSMLDGKIKHLESRSEDYEHSIAEAQENITACASSVNEQQRICNVLSGEINEIVRDMMKIETRLESTPIQKVIDADSVRQSIDSFKNDISSLNSRNQELQVTIDTTDLVVQKIDKFIETFNYSTWKEKKQEIADLRAELTEANSNLSLVEREKRNLYEKKTLLQQVPCGSEYSHCKFIRSAYEKIEEEPEVEERYLSLKNSRTDVMVKIEELEPDTVDKYLSQYTEVLQKRQEKKSAVTDFELEIAKNKTTIVRLRDSLSKSEEEFRLFEENEKVIVEFASLTKERNILLKDKAKKGRELSQCQERISILNKEHAAAENKLQSLTENYADLQVSRRDYSAYDLYRKSMGQNGVSLDIIKRELPSINQEIAKILFNRNL